MPHVVIEYSDNLKSEIVRGHIVGLAHTIMVESGLFAKADIKTRAHATSNFSVGDKCGQGRFVHVTVSILEGRPLEAREALSKALCDALAQKLPHADQLTVEVREMARATYQKRVSNPAADPSA